MDARGSKPRSHVLASRQDIEHLRSPHRLLWKLGGRIELRVPEIPAGDRDRIESRLNELAGICGCAEASGVGAIAMIAVGVWWVRHDVAFSVRSVTGALAIVIGTMLLTKLVRVLIARWQLRINLGHLLGQH